MLRSLLSNLVILTISIVYNSSFALYSDDSGSVTYNGKIDNLSREVESLLVSKILKSMHEGVKINSVTGGGETEKIYRDILMDEYAKEITKRDGIGLRKSIINDIKRNDLSHRRKK